VQVQLNRGARITCGALRYSKTEALRALAGFPEKSERRDTLGARLYAKAVLDMQHPLHEICTKTLQVPSSMYNANKIARIAEHIIN
jgi:hypothetical protein